MTNDQIALALAFISFLVFCVTIVVGAVTLHYAAEIGNQEKTGNMQQLPPEKTSRSEGGDRLRRILILLNFLVLALIASGGAAIYYWLIP